MRVGFAGAPRTARVGRSDVASIGAQLAQFNHERRHGKRLPACRIGSEISEVRFHNAVFYRPDSFPRLNAETRRTRVPAARASRDSAARGGTT
jgi:hypothetical protein